MSHKGTDRRRFLATCTALGLSGTLFPGALYAKVRDAEEITKEDIQRAEEVAGLSFTEDQRDMLVEDLNERLEDFEELRQVDLPNSVLPAFVFDPQISGVTPSEEASTLQWEPSAITRPADDEALAFMTVAELASLLKARQVTSMELTELYLRRLKQYDPVLEAVVTFTEDLARVQAARADAELDAGNWRGPLHGVPYGAKDLLSVKGYKTTWGAMPYKDQVIDENAAVVDKLEAAGAVLVAKLTLGALAWGDVWFGGTTKNPWNIEQGSSGSSAGPGSAVAAGLVGFAIGSETLGSIVSPSTRNGVTGHRPTFGTVSRHGAMTLSWSMDKLGPMTRSALDCALVYEVLRGVDVRDPSTFYAPFPFDANLDVTTLRVGYLKAAFEEDYSGQQADNETLAVLRNLGVNLQPMALPEDLPVGAMLMTLSVEAAAAFDALTRTGVVDQMVRQERNAWPHTFRSARFVPAVEFLQANRTRTLLMQQMAEILQDIDVFISPSFGGGTLRITNLTGHPCVCLPNAFNPLEDAAADSSRRQPGSITFAGNLYKDAEVLALAHAYQQ
ncbi:MAG TPA: amidase family protein, partial [Rhodothermales bacterium]|nr:amidase family protein [Rhodothermales bacterium]